MKHITVKYILIDEITQKDILSKLSQEELIEIILDLKEQLEDIKLESFNNTNI